MPTCRVWPDGAFGLSNIDRKFQMEAFREREEPSAHTDFIAKQIEVHGVEAVIEACVKTSEWHRNLTALGEESEDCNMESTIVPNSLRAKRGQKGISRHGRLLVRNAAFLMERANALDTVTFLTTTLPPMDLESNRYVVENWAKVVKNFTLRLGRKLKDAGLMGEIVGVTEVQERRFSAHAHFVGLHLHCLFVGRKPHAQWAIPTALVEEYWRDAIASVSKSIARDCDWSRSTNLQRLKSSGAAYIGKYLSKGVAIVRQIKEAHPDLSLPPCWYTCTLSLRAKVEKLQVVGSKPARKIQEWIDAGMVEYFANITTVTIPSDRGGDICIGWAGRLSEKGRNALSLPYTPNGLPRVKRLFPDGL